MKKAARRGGSPVLVLQTALDQNDVRRSWCGSNGLHLPTKVRHEVCNDIIADAGPTIGSRIAARGILATDPAGNQRSSWTSTSSARSAPKEAYRRGLQNHYRRIEIQKQPRSRNDIELNKSNILLIGPTGTGKDAARADARQSCSRCPSPSSTPRRSPKPGYVGEDVENIILKLPQSAGGGIERRSTASSTSTRSTRFAAGRETLRSRATCRAKASSRRSEDSRRDRATFPPQGGRKHPHQEFFQVDTTNILFICGGAFVGLTGHWKRIRPKTMASSGRHQVGQRAAVTSAPRSNSSSRRTSSAWPIPEFVGRLPGHRHAPRALTRRRWSQILTQPKNAIKQYQRCSSGTRTSKLRFTDEALQAIAKERSSERASAASARG